MVKYIIKDMIEVFQYLPYGIIAGIIMAIILATMNKKKKIPIASITCFVMYFVIMLVITFFSRENGSRNGVDLKLFSTWGINARNNAFVIENILLFIPYGFVLAWAVKSARNVFVNLFLSFATSLGIETMQLITRRGYFQIDDILTNTLGAFLGYILFRCILSEEKTERQKTNIITIILVIVLISASILGIISFSSDSPIESHHLSMQISQYVTTQAEEWLEISLTNSEQQVVLKFVNPVIRKLAHATEYAALAIVVGFALQFLKRNRSRVVNYFYAIIICGMIATLDETLQRYIFGRTGQFSDVVIDVMGALIGGCIYVFLSELVSYLIEEDKE